MQNKVVSAIYVFLPDLNRAKYFLTLLDGRKFAVSMYFALTRPLDVLGEGFLALCKNI
jgi:hypothetical protein